MRKCERGSMAPFRFLLLICLLLFIGFSATTHAAEETSAPTERSYVFVFQPAEGYMSVSAIDLMDIFNNVIDDLNKKTGVKMILKNIANSSVEEAFQQGKADFALLGTDHVLSLKKKGTEVKPLVLLSAFKKQGAQVCIYTKGNYQDIKSLKGAKVSIFGAGSFSVYSVLRKLLFENNIDMPLGDFFGSLYKIPTNSSVYQALILDKIDVAIDIDWYYEFHSKSIPQMETVKSIACTDEYPVVGIFMRKGVDKDDIKKLRKYFIKLHKNPVLGAARTLFIAIDAKLVVPDPIFMQRYEMVYQEAVEKGWREESMEFAKKMKELDFGQELKKEKKTYIECKEQCKNEEDWETCLDECMGE